MQFNLLWTSMEYHSLENCLVTTRENGSVITSTIIGYYAEKIYRIEYYIKTNPKWETLFVGITSHHSNQEHRLKLQSDGNGNWVSEGKKLAQFEGCIDIDIPLTPFTNTLPINRLKLTQNQSKEINVIYLDILG